MSDSQMLPADKVREQVFEVLDDIQHGRHDWPKTIYVLKETLGVLPAPSVLTMGRVEWDDEEHHLAEADTKAAGKVVMLSQDVGDDGEPDGWITCSIGGVAETFPKHQLAPTGRKFLLYPGYAEPADGTPK